MGSNFGEWSVFEVININDFLWSGLSKKEEKGIDLQQKAKEQLYWQCITPCIKEKGPPRQEQQVDPHQRGKVAVHGCKLCGKSRRSPNGLPGRMGWQEGHSLRSTVTAHKAPPKAHHQRSALPTPEHER
eukprot:1160764-Pelagomonas_calceolata.AAC.1